MGIKFDYVKVWTHEGEKILKYHDEIWTEWDDFDKNLLFRKKDLHNVEYSNGDKEWFLGGKLVKSQYGICSKK